MVLRSSRARKCAEFAVWLLVALATVQAALAVANFTPQRRVGYTTGDQWEPALAADGHGHIYILFPQYGAVSDCPACTAPTISLMVSNDNGVVVGNSTCAVRFLRPGSLIRRSWSIPWITRLCMLHGCKIISAM